MQAETRDDRQHSRGPVRLVSVRMLVPFSCKASDVERLAKELEAEQRSPRNAQQAVVRAAEMPKGELAALVFERLEQRHSISEIVIALRVPPEDVRELYHTWLVGLWAGELRRNEPALPARHTDQDAIRRVTAVQLAQLLKALPTKQATRISVARMVGEAARCASRFRCTDTSDLRPPKSDCRYVSEARARR